jgi:hypothetical protein
VVCELKLLVDEIIATGVDEAPALRRKRAAAARAKSVGREGQSDPVSLFPFPFVSFLFKRNIPIGGVVIAQAPEVGQVVTEIDEIEARDPVSIYLLLVNQLVPEQCRWDFRLTVLEENRSSDYHSMVTSQEWQLENPVSVSDASNLARSQHHES